MYLEKRRSGKGIKYFLAHSFRDSSRIRKIRRYLGENLSDAELKEKRKKAEAIVHEHLRIYREIRDPLNTVLSKEELAQLNGLDFKIDVSISHLSEREWSRFTEAFTYDTNAIEGSTVSLGNVEDILEKKKWPENASKSDVSETYGVSDAVAFIRKTKEHLSVGMIKELHKIVFLNSKRFAGKLRKKGIEVVIRDSRGGIIHRGAPSPKIYGLLKELIAWYESNRKRYHPVVLAAIVHNQFENIHPFQDGNGRVGRLLLNNILLKHGLPPVNIELKKRAEYYLALQAYEKRGDLRPTIELIMSEYKRLKEQLRK